MAEAPPNTGLMDMECLSSLSCNATKDFQRHEKQGRTNAERRCRNILTVATVLVVSFIVVQAVLGIAGHRAALSSPRVEWPVSFPDYQNGFSKELYRFVQREYIKDKGYGAPADSVKCVCSPRTHCPGEGDERRKGCCMSRVSEPSGRETSRCDMMVLGLAQVAKSCRNINMTCDEMGIVYFNMNGTRCYELAEQHKKHYCAALEEEFHLDMVTTHPKVFQSPEDLNISLLHKLQGRLEDVKRETLELVSIPSLGDNTLDQLYESAVSQKVQDLTACLYDGMREQYCGGDDSPSLWTVQDDNKTKSCVRDRSMIPSSVSLIHNYSHLADSKGPWHNDLAESSVWNLQKQHYWGELYTTYVYLCAPEQCVAEQKKTMLDRVLALISFVGGYTSAMGLLLPWAWFGMLVLSQRQKRIREKTCGAEQWIEELRNSNVRPSSATEYYRPLEEVTRPNLGMRDREEPDEEAAAHSAR